MLGLFNCFLRIVIGKDFIIHILLTSLFFGDPALQLFPQVVKVQDLLCIL